MEDQLDDFVQTFRPCKVMDAHCVFDREVNHGTKKRIAEVPIIRVLDIDYGFLCLKVFTKLAVAAASQWVVAFASFIRSYDSQSGSAYVAPSPPSVGLRGKSVSI